MASRSLSFYYNCEAPLALVAASLLQQFASAAASAAVTFEKARQLHALIVVASPFRSSSPPFLFNNLLSLYSKCGYLGYARWVFDSVPNRNLISYNAMISAYSRAPRHAAFALELFRQLSFAGLEPNASTFSSLVYAASSIKDPLVASSVHSKVVRCGFCNNVCIQTALVGMYSESRNHGAANRVFSEMGDGKDVVAWNAIIVNNVKNDNVLLGLQQFCSMLDTGLMPNNCTFTIVVNACRKLEDQHIGRVIHAKMILSEMKPDLPLQNALIDMYSSYENMVTASLLFEKIEEPDLVSWNSLIAGYSGIGEGKKAMEVFTKLRLRGPQPDEYTFAGIVSATASFNSLCWGKPLHAQIVKLGLESSVYVGNTLINMYFINEEPDSAREIFNFIDDKDVVIWTEMIVGHSRLGEGELALKYFYYMLSEGHKVDCFSLSSALKSSGDLAAMRQGEMIHSQVIQAGYEANMCVSGSLVDMYAKNGDIGSASSVFYGIETPDLKCWNSMIGGHGYFGNAGQAFVVFNIMVGNGLQPDHVTYISLLSTCSHSGLVERGKFYWFCMITDGIVPGIKHYTCMVNLLSRAGLLQEAEELILASPFTKFPELWRILLSSCVISKNLSIGVHAAEQVLILDPDDSSIYILLSKLYASLGRWNSVASMRKKIRESALDKEPGLSWIEVNKRTHIFSADDESHPHIADCRNELFRLKGNLQGLEQSELHFPVILDAMEEGFQSKQSEF